MTDRFSARLYSAVQAPAEFRRAFDWAKERLMYAAVDGREVRYTLSVKPATRSQEQNDKFHAICTDLERSKLPWAGKPRTKDEWKVLLVSGHAVATKQGADMVPGLENEFVNLRESTSRMSVARASSLIEYALAFCAANDVEVKDAEPA